ncbi:hypothetical protein N9K06_00620 [Omnitrophica bacterium]|nr:hypothetical protein [Candidatus Omnitrophota bacterium]
MVKVIEKSEVFKPKPGLRSGYGVVRCPNPECDYILFEASKKFWYTHQIGKMMCEKCETPASIIACLQPEDDAGELIIRYWCHHCGAGFQRTMIGVREYCNGCKTYQNIYFSMAMSIPQSPQPLQATHA